MPKLFSYGTLQLPQVQLDTFGRHLEGISDAIIGFKLELVEITDPAVLASSGQTHHPILRRSDSVCEEVAGTVFDISDDELRQADSYEVDDYERIEVPLKSGLTCWAYVERLLK
ncbi:gamma-glutamylcyclotransferase family protein [Pseudoalteromonas xiamenensis]